MVDVPAAQGPMVLMREGYSKFGEVFTVPVLHKNITFLIGPHVTPHFFKARDDQLSQTEVLLMEKTSLRSRVCPTTFVNSLSYENAPLITDDFVDAHNTGCIGCDAGVQVQCADIWPWGGV